MADFGIGEALLASSAGDAAIADMVGLSSADLIGSGAVDAVGAGAAGAGAGYAGAGFGEGALTAADLVGSGAIPNLAPTVASGAFDTAGFQGIDALTQATDPVSRAIQAANMANVTGAAPNAFQGITELDAAQTADLMKNIDPRMINSLAPTATDVASSSALDTTAGPFNPGPNMIGADLEQLPANIPSYSALNAPLATAPSYLDQALSLADKYKTPLMLAAGSAGIKSLLGADKGKYGINQQALQPYSGPLSKFSYDPSRYTPAANPSPVYYKARYAMGGTIDPGYDRVVGDPSTQPPQQPVMQDQSFAAGGIAQLAVGGKLLKGQGDGMSDSIQANISGKREARLADGEFVVPADVVSHLGNGSTDAGAKQLYAMMDKVRTARTGRKSQGRQITPQKYMPA